MQPDSMRKAILKIYLWVLGLGFGYYLFILLTGLSLPCLYYQATGLQCAGCGSSRMFLAMARLDFAKAFSYNPVVFSLFFLWNAIAAFAFWGKPGFVRQPRFLYTALWVTVGALCSFWVLRNSI